MPVGVLYYVKYLKLINILNMIRRLSVDSPPISGVVIQHDKCSNQMLVFVCHWLRIRYNQSLCFAVSNTAYSTLIVYKLNLKVLVMVRCVDSVRLCLLSIKRNQRLRASMRIKLFLSSPAISSTLSRDQL